MIAAMIALASDPHACLNLIVEKAHGHELHTRAIVAGRLHGLQVPIRVGGRVEQQQHDANVAALQRRHDVRS
jgi:hypothetical protein